MHIATFAYYYMISPKALLFLAIQQQIATILDVSNNLAFPFVERDMGQLDNGSKPPVIWPCTLIRIIDGNYKQLGENVQEGVLTVTIRIGFPPYSSTGIKTPAKYKNKALYYYDLEQLMYQSMHGWSPGIVTVLPAADPDPAVTADLSDIFGSLIRVQDIEEDREDFIVVAKQTYTITIDDWSAAETIAMIPVTPDISDEIEA